MDLWGPQSICGALNKVCLLVDVWNPVGFDERSIYGHGWTLADPAVGFGGGQLGKVTQARVPPKLKTPRIWPTIFWGLAQNHVQK